MWGVRIDEAHLLFPPAFFRQQDLTERWDLGRKFDLVLCLEVGEHLPPASAATLVESLVAHSDLVAFSAACPGQNGQHHVNCQWLEYWQRLFNGSGYVCDDSIRWKIWNIEAIEPWYRQNMFLAARAPTRAGQEPRIRPVIHPQMLATKTLNLFEAEWKDRMTLIEAGHHPTKWYFTTPIKGCTAKVKRKMGRLFRLPR